MRAPSPPPPLLPTLTLKWKPIFFSSTNKFNPYPLIKSSSFSNTSSQNSVFTLKMALNYTNTLISTTSAATTNINNNNGRRRRLPVLLFDVMDTIVRDPFYHDIPQFFGMSMKELLECKHPTAWIEFEKGLINEEELARKFFKDGRPFDLVGLKSCIRQGYSYLEGLEGLLRALKHNGYEMHAFTNYPIWYKMIEDKLKLSTYLSWTFCSCTSGKRKPESDFYLEALKHLAIEPASCIFIDDRMRNVEAAKEVGIVGLQFKNADTLRQDLSLLEVDISTHDETSVNEDLSDIAQEQSS